MTGLAQLVTCDGPMSHQLVVPLLPKRFSEHLVFTKNAVPNPSQCAQPGASPLPL